MATNPSDDRTKIFIFPSGIEVYGGFVGGENNLGDRRPDLHPTILSGDIGTPGDASDNCYCVVFPLQLTVPSLIDGFTIRDGYGGWPVDLKDSGAGMYITGGASPSIVNCRFINNQVSGPAPNTAGGGGVYVDDGAPSFIACRFENNTADFGAAIAATSGWSELIIDRCVFLSNTARNQAAALYNSRGGRTSLKNSIMMGNTCLDVLAGGTIANAGADFRLVNALVHNNPSFSPTIYNAANAASTITNATVTYNPHGCEGALKNDGDTTVVNCLIWGNTAGLAHDQSAQVWNYLTFNITYCSVEGWASGGTGNNADQPLFVDAANDDFHQLANSPCRSNGNYAAVNGIPYDLDGLSRTTKNQVDRGAYEYHLVECEVGSHGRLSRDDIADCSAATPWKCDCNGNNIPDGCDITSGFSMDCNHKEC